MMGRAMAWTDTRLADGNPVTLTSAICVGAVEADDSKAGSASTNEIPRRFARREVICRTMGDVSGAAPAR